MKIHEAALKALQELGEPSKVLDIYNFIIKNKYFNFGSKDPLSTLTTSLARHSIGVGNSITTKDKLFYRSAPRTYGIISDLSTEDIKSIESEDEIIEQIEMYKPNSEMLDTNLFLEIEWHKWLFKNLRSNGLEALGFGKLALYDEDEQFEKNGKYNTSEVGEIDLLLKSKNKIVVIELKRKGTDETIGQICRYVGWVQKNLAKPKDKVFGVIIAQNISTELRYAMEPIKDYVFYQQLILSVEFGESSKKDKLL